MWSLSSDNVIISLPSTHIPNGFYQSDTILGLNSFQLGVWEVTAGVNHGSREHQMHSVGYPPNHYKETSLPLTRGNIEVSRSTPLTGTVLITPFWALSYLFRHFVVPASVNCRQGWQPQQ